VRLKNPANIQKTKRT